MGEFDSCSYFNQYRVKPSIMRDSTGLAQFYDLERSMPYTVPRETRPTLVVSNIHIF